MVNHVEYVKRKLMKAYNTINPDYYHQGINKSFFQRRWHELKMKIILEALNGSKNLTLLDVGCDGGILCDVLHKKGFSVIGLDFSRTFLKRAKKENPTIDFILGDAEWLPFKNGSFDVLTCIETLEHLSDILRAISEASRTLKFNGLYVTLNEDDNNFLWRFCWFLWLKKAGSVWKGLHVTKITQNNVKEVINNSNLKVKSISRSHFGMVFTLCARKQNALKKV